MPRRKKELPDQVKINAADVAKMQETLNLPGKRVSDTLSERDLIVRNKETLKAHEKSELNVVDKFLDQRLGKEQEPIEEVVNQEQQQEPVKPTVPKPEVNLEDVLSLSEFEAEVDGNVQVPEVPEVEEVVQPQETLEAPPKIDIPEELPEVPTPTILDLVDGENVHYWHKRFKYIEGKHRSDQTELKQLRQQTQDQISQISALKAEVRELRVNKPITDKDLIEAGYDPETIDYNRDIYTRQLLQNRQYQYDLENRDIEYQKQLKAIKDEFLSANKVDPQLEKQKQDQWVIEQVDILTPGFAHTNAHDRDFIAFLNTEMRPGLGWGEIAGKALDAKDVQTINKIYLNYLHKKNQEKLEMHAVPSVNTKSAAPLAQVLRNEPVAPKTPPKEKRVSWETLDQIDRFLMYPDEAPPKYQGREGRAKLQKLRKAAVAKISKGLVEGTSQTA